MAPAQTFEQMWAALLPIGRSARTGGYHRLTFTAAEREARAWFLEECRARDLAVESDPAGFATVAWWRPELRGPGRAVLTGSHLDSVVEGGGFDGPLGVVSALAAVDLLRARGFEPARPVGVVVFLEEEGARFGLPCLGSRVLTGQVVMHELARLRDPAGVAFLDAAEAAGAPVPAGASDAGRRAQDPLARDLLAETGCFVELHVEQGRDLVHRDAPVGVGGAIWPHGRYRFDFTGEPNHAGTTRMEDRRDPMLSYAMTVLAANKQARLTGQRATFGRVAVTPNGTNAVPQRVTGWLDARAETTERLLGLVAEIERLAVDRAGRDGTDLVVTPESVTPAIRFDPDLVARLAALGDPGGWPVVATAAGHDAGILAAAGVPSAMLFVRNPTGVSHAPGEHAETVDCLAGVAALADALAWLAG